VIGRWAALRRRLSIRRRTGGGRRSLARLFCRGKRSLCAHPTDFHYRIAKPVRSARLRRKEQDHPKEAC